MMLPRFPKLKFLKVVSVTMIAITEKLKMRKYHSFYHLLSFSIPRQMVWKKCSPSVIFNHVYLSKNLRNNISLFTCVLFGVFWLFLTPLLLLAMFNMVYCKNFPGQNLPYSFDQIKLKGSILSSKVRNPWKFFKPNNPKEDQILESKNFRVV